MAAPDGWERSLDELHPRIEETVNLKDLETHLKVECGGFLSEADIFSVFGSDNERRLDSVNKLVDLLKTKGPKAFEAFCSILTDHGYSDLAQELITRRLSYESESVQKSSKLTDAEAVVPLCLGDLVDYTSQIAPKWKKLALKLGLHPSEVQSLQDGQDSQDDKCLQVLQLAIEQGRLTSWSQLLEVLRSKALKMPQLAEEINRHISAKCMGTFQLQTGECKLSPGSKQKDTLEQSSDGICESQKHDLKTVPFLMEDAVDYIDSIAPKWNMLGMKLGLQNEVQILQHSPISLCDKCIQIFLLALEQGKITSWSQLLDVLRSDAVKMTHSVEEIEKDMLMKYTGANPSSEVASSMCKNFDVIDQEKGQTFVFSSKTGQSHPGGNPSNIESTRFDSEMQVNHFMSDQMLLLAVPDLLAEHGKSWYDFGLMLSMTDGTLNKIDEKFINNDHKCVVMLETLSQRASIYSVLEAKLSKCPDKWSCNFWTAIQKTAKQPPKFSPQLDIVISGHINEALLAQGKPDERLLQTLSDSDSVARHYWQIGRLLGLSRETMQHIEESFDPGKLCKKALKVLRKWQENYQGSTLHLCQVLQYLDVDLTSFVEMMIHSRTDTVSIEDQKFSKCQ